MDQPVSLDEAAEARAGNWTVKAVPLRTRLKATTAARKAGKPVWQWLEWAVDVADSQQGRNTVTANSSNPAGQPEAPDLERLITVAGLPDLPRWMRTKVNRMIAERLGIDLPVDRLRHQTRRITGPTESPETQ